MELPKPYRREHASTQPSIAPDSFHNGQESTGTVLKSKHSKGRTPEGAVETALDEERSQASLDSGLPRRAYKLINETRGVVISERIGRAEKFWQRLIGLMFRGKLG